MITTIIKQLVRIVEDPKLMSEPDVRKAFGAVLNSYDTDFTSVEFEHSAATDKLMEDLLREVDEIENPVIAEVTNGDDEDEDEDDAYEDDDDSDDEDDDVYDDGDEKDS